jgi:hypothetical protein
LNLEVRVSVPLLITDDDDGAVLDVSGDVEGVNAETRTASVLISATSSGIPVLSRASARVRIGNSVATA